MLTKWNPFWEVKKLEKDFCDLFVIPNRSNFSWSPIIDVSEDDTKILIEAEVPGVAPEDMELTVDSDVLTLKGKKSLENKKRGYISERLGGSFIRSFSLPPSVEIDMIQAKYDKGIISVEIPKKPSNIPKQIKINISG